MELLNLGEDELIHIFKYLNRKSLLNSMLVCKKFEAIICQYIQFYEKFQVLVTKDRKILDRLSHIRRNFATVKLSDLDLNLDTDHYKIIFQFFKDSGGKIVNLEINNCSLSSLSFMKLVSLVKNINKLVLGDVSITPKRVFIDGSFLKNLRIFSCKYPKNLCMLDQIIPTKSISEMKMQNELEFKKVKDHDIEVFQNIVYKQENLTSLELAYLKLNFFPSPPENGSFSTIQKLSLLNLDFLNPTAFLNFQKFIKMLDNVADLHLNVLWDQRINNNNYTEILKHLFSLSSLKKLVFDLCMLQLDTINVQIKNPAVETFSLVRMQHGVYYKQWIEMFPNVQYASLTFGFSEYLPAYLGSVIFWTNLKELKLAYVTDTMLKTVKSKEFRKLVLMRFDCLTPSSWIAFAENTGNKLEHLEIQQASTLLPIFEHLKIITTCFTNLKVLKIGMEFKVEEEKEVIELIGKNLKKLEFLQMNLCHNSSKSVVELLKTCLPGLRGKVGPAYNPDLIQEF